MASIQPSVSFSQVGRVRHWLVFLLKSHFYFLEISTLDGDLCLVYTSMQQKLSDQNVHFLKTTVEQNYVCIFLICFISCQNKGEVVSFLLSFSLWNMWLFETYRSISLNRTDFILVYLNIQREVTHGILTIALLQKKRLRHARIKCHVQDSSTGNW